MRGSKLVQWTGYHYKTKWMSDTQWGPMDFISWARLEVQRFRSHGIEAEIRPNDGGEIAIWKENGIK